MSLTDTDKNSDSRTSPQLNQTDQLNQTTANSTTSINPVTDDTATVGFLKSANGQLLANDGTNNIGLFGFDANGDMVVKVAQSGFDADTATNDELVFNSAQNVFKIVSKITTTIPSFTCGLGGTNYGLRTITHGLSSPPIILAFSSGAFVKGDTGLNTSAYIPIPSLVPRIGFGYVFPETIAGNYRIANIVMGIDNTKIYFQAETDSGGAAGTMAAISVVYYILQETAV